MGLTLLWVRAQAQARRHSSSLRKIKPLKVDKMAPRDLPVAWPTAQDAL